MIKVYQSGVVGTGPWCVEFPDGEVISTRTEERANRIAGAVRDVGEYLKMIATAGEDFPGQRNDARRAMIVEAATGAADRIILHYADGSVEDLEYLTAAVTKEFFEKMVQATQMALFRKELLDGTKDHKTRSSPPNQEALPGSPETK